MCSSDLVMNLHFNTCRTPGFQVFCSRKAAVAFPFMSSKWRIILLICVCQVLVMTLWFATTAVVPSLQRESELTPFRVSLLTSSVQVGFVTGTLISALLGLADRLDLRRFFMTAAGIAAFANLLILAMDPGSLGIPALRFVTGICMAGVYPVGMKMAASWAKGDMGLLVALLVGALTLGSASPHFLNGIGGLNWRITLLLASACAFLGAVMIPFAKVGPNFAKAPKFRPESAFKAWTTRSLRFANLAYFGHMWELYAMWAWIGVFLQSSFALAMNAESAVTLSKFATFATIGSGAVGCVVAGWSADRWGRTTVAITAMVLSGSCSLLIGFLYGSSPSILIAVCLLWGITVVADSAQFSASVAELSEPSLVGTMLTIQTSVGFLLTLVTIHLIPEMVDAFGWRYAFALLSIGPFLGSLAMARLRSMNEAAALAGGRR
jgi:MFS family permease